MSTLTQEQLAARMTIIEAALRAGDGDTAVTVIELIAAEGHKDIADRITNTLIASRLGVSL